MNQTHPYRYWYSSLPERKAAQRKLLKGRYDAALLALPPAATQLLVLKLASAKPDKLYIWAEKPWFLSCRLAACVRNLLARDPWPKVVFGDHYCCKPNFRWLAMQPLPFFLGGPVKRIKGRLYEPIGLPIARSAKVGATRDLLIHLVSSVHRLVPGCSINVTSAWLARHFAFPYDSESWVRFRGETDSGVELDLAAGKDWPGGLRKVVEIEGSENRLIVDFVNNTVRCAALCGGPAYQLFPFDGMSAADKEPDYSFILRRLVQGDTSIGFTADQAIRILKTLRTVRRMGGCLPA
jgi:hypothetical protein